MRSSISAFDRLVSKTLAQQGHFAFLITLLEKKVIHGGQVMVRYSAGGIENCVRGFDFACFKKHVMEQSCAWDLVVVRVANVADGSTPYLDACAQELNRIEASIVSRDVTGMAVFDKRGEQFNDFRLQKKDFSDLTIFDAMSGAQGADLSASRGEVTFSAMAKDFDGLLMEVRKLPQNSTLLVSFLKVFPASSQDPAASTLTVAAQGFFPCANDELSFDTVGKEASDAMVEWDMLAVGIASNRDASPASREQCEAWLVDMRQRIDSGDIGSLVVFTARGDIVQAIPTRVESGSTSREDGRAQMRLH